MIVVILGIGLMTMSSCWMVKNHPTSYGQSSPATFTLVERHTTDGY